MPHSTPISALPYNPLITPHTHTPPFGDVFLGGAVGMWECEMVQTVGEIHSEEQDIYTYNLTSEVHVRKHVSQLGD